MNIIYLFGQVVGNCWQFIMVDLNYCQLLSTQADVPILINTYSTQILNVCSKLIFIEIVMF